MTDSATAPTVAVVGCGAIASMQHVPALAQYPGVRERLVLVDQDLDRARGLARAFDAPSVAADYREVLGAVDGVVIALPHQLHYRVALDCLRAGNRGQRDSEADAAARSRPRQPRRGPPGSPRRPRARRTRARAPAPGPDPGRRVRAAPAPRGIVRAPGRAACWRSRRTPRPPPLAPWRCPSWKPLELKEKWSGDHSTEPQYSCRSTNSSRSTPQTHGPPDATLRRRNTGGDHTDGGGTGGPHGLRLRVRFLLSYADDDAIRRASAQRTAATIAGDSAIARPPGATSRRRRAAPQHASVCVSLVRAGIRVPTRGSAGRLPGHARGVAGAHRCARSRGLQRRHNCPAAPVSRAARITRMPSAGTRTGAGDRDQQGAHPSRGHRPRAAGSTRSRGSRGWGCGRGTARRGAAGGDQAERVLVVERTGRSTPGSPTRRHRR